MLPSWFSTLSLALNARLSRDLHLQGPQVGVYGGYHRFCTEWLREEAVL
jgi:hypothetical protein